MPGRRASRRTANELVKPRRGDVAPAAPRLRRGTPGCQQAPGHAGVAARSACRAHAARSCLCAPAPKRTRKGRQQSVVARRTIWRTYGAPPHRALVGQRRRRGPYDTYLIDGGGARSVVDHLLKADSEARPVRRKVASYPEQAPDRAPLRPTVRAGPSLNSVRSARAPRRSPPRGWRGPSVRIRLERVVARPVRVTPLICL
jgi:hypothetical protein